MADLSRYPDSNGDTGMGPDRESSTSIPRWVKVFGIIALVLVVLFVILHLAGRGLGGHRPSGSPGGQTPSMERGVQQP